MTKEPSNEELSQAVRYLLQERGNLCRAFSILHTAIHSLEGMFVKAEREASIPLEKLGWTYLRDTAVMSRMSACTQREQKLSVAFPRFLVEIFEKEKANGG